MLASGVEITPSTQSVAVTRQAATSSNGAGNSTVKESEKQALLGGRKTTEKTAREPYGDKDTDGTKVPDKQSSGSRTINLGSLGEENLLNLLQGYINSMINFAGKNRNVHKELKDTLTNSGRVLTQFMRVKNASPKNKGLVCAETQTEPLSRSNDQTRTVNETTKAAQAAKNTTDVSTDTPCWWPTLHPEPQQPQPLLLHKQETHESKPQQWTQNQQETKGASNPPHSNENTTWKEVTSRHKRTQKEQRFKNRPDVVIVKAGNMPYSEMLKKIKTSDEMKTAGSSINAVTKTKDGLLRMVLNRGTDDIDHLTSAITNSIGSDASCTRLSDTSVIEIRDADEEATDEEIVQAIQTHAKLKGSIKIIKKRKIDRGTQIITVSVPTSVAITLVSSRLRIGYVNCRVRRRIEVKKCFRCQGFGHTRHDCTYEERNNLCWQCGGEGHKSRECNNTARCFLCKDEATYDHLLGSFKCHAYKRALEELKTNK